MNRKGFLVSFCIALCCCLLQGTAARGSDMILESIDSKGLSNSCINCIFQDPYDRTLWLGTWDGLNVYDGSRFVTLKYDAFNDNSICNNIIRNIVMESPGILWVSTDYGVSRINRNNGEISRFYPGYEGSVPASGGYFHVAVLDSGTVYCASTGWGVSFYDPENHRLSDLNISQFNTSDIIGIYDYGGNILLAMDSEGVIHSLQCGDNPKTPIVYTGPVMTGISRVFDDMEEMFIATKDGNMFVHKKESGSIDFLMTLPDRLTAVADVTRLGDGTLVLAQMDGNVWLCPEGSEPVLAGEMSNINIFSLYAGDQNILWVGSDGEGLLKYYSTGMSFGLVRNQDLNTHRSSAVRSFLQDESGNLYIGTKGSGIVELSPSERTLRTFDIKSGLSDDNVFVLCKGLSDKEIIAGSDGKGVDVILPASGRVIHIAPEKGGTQWGNVYSIYRDTRNDCLWIATNGYGLIRLSYELTGGHIEIRDQVIYTTESGPRPISSNAIFSIVPEDATHLWLATRGGGLCLFDTATAEADIWIADPDVPQSIIHNDILSLCKDIDGNLWIGTSFGLSCLPAGSKDSGRFINYSESDGLLNNSIHGILSDGRSSLWMSTNNGLVHFNPLVKTFTNYYDFYNLQGNEYSDGAYFLSDDGVMFFGGVNGFNYFRPEDIKARSFSPPISFDDLYVNQELVEDFDPSRLLELAYNANSFSIKFHAVDYIRPESCEYEFMLHNFDKDWISMGTSHTAVYTNIPPGNYELLVRCSNGDKVWNSDIWSVKIHVGKPWWKTFWFHAALLALLACAIALLYWFNQKRMKEKEAIHIEQLEKQQQAENYEARLRFFVNLSHEFCTPLTLISGSTEYILDNEELPSSAVRHLKVIGSNASRMQRLIGELLEFRKADTGHYVPSYSRINVCDTIKSVVDNFAEAVEIKRIFLSVNMPDEETVIVTDPGALEKILYNLISNALKYTPEQGYIRITLSRENDCTEIDVTNSGLGIKEEDIPKVFNRFEVLNSFEKELKKGKIMRSGVGLSYAKILAETLSGNIKVESILNEHTSFTLSLPDIDEKTVSLSEAGFDGLDYYVPATVEDDYEAGEPADDVVSGRNQTVMVVDDEQQICELLRDIFETAGLSVVNASDGSQALDILSRMRPDVIISDIIMPGMSGTELLKTIRENPMTKYIPFVFLTFKSDVVDQIEGTENGADAFISKPFHAKHLLAVVEHLLESRTGLKNFYNSTLSNSDVFEGNIVDSDDKKFLVKLTRLIEDNLTEEKLSLDFLSEKMFVSRVQLYRKIKTLTDKTPSDFINSIKIKYAAHQIKTTGKRIQEIMFDSGFNNKSYFYKVFEKTYGESPKAMRTRLSQNEN